jgi:hypothetical protein
VIFQHFRCEASDSSFERAPTSTPVLLDERTLDFPQVEHYHLSISSLRRQKVTVMSGSLEVVPDLRLERRLVSA